MIEFFQANKGLFDTFQAIGSVVNLVGWLVGAVLLWVAWRRNAIKTVAVGPIQFQVQEAAVEATTTAARGWKSTRPTPHVDLEKVRQTVARAFTHGSRIIGKSVLWVDDNPANNRLVVRALRKLQLDVEQATSTEAALAALHQRHFDLIISDMGRGGDDRAGYTLLKAVRDHGEQMPVFIFSSGDTPEFRKEAADLGAQLSTNDMLELTDSIIKHLGR